MSTALLCLIVVLQVALVLGYDLLEQRVVCSHGVAIKVNYFTVFQVPVSMYRRNIQFMLHAKVVCWND